jgi:F-type H+-transporting ATPase subunit b
MPQLDLTTYSSQIFWFALCFITLYIATSCLILPRISAILKNRKNIIDADLASAKDLDDKIYELESQTDKLRKDATSKYQIKLEEATKSATKQREKMIEDLKTKIDQNVAKSHKELQDLIAKSQSESETAIKNLTQQIEQKLTNV